MANRSQIISRNTTTTTRISNAPTSVKKTNKGNDRKLKPAQSKAPKTTVTKLPPLLSGNLSPLQPNGTLQNQHFSSRNALRSAQSASRSDSSVNKFADINSLSIPPMAQLPIREDFGELTLPSGFGDPSQYDKLNSECFIHIRRDDLICFLCGRREKMRGRGAFENHLESEHHNRNFWKLTHELLNQAIPDSSLQMSVIRELCARWYNSQALPDMMISSRLNTIQEFNLLLSTINPECYLRLIGSLATRTSLVTSDINLELIHPNSKLFEKDPRAKNSIHHKLIDQNAGYGYQINNHTLHYDLCSNAVETLYKIMYSINNRFPGSPSNSFEVISNQQDLNATTPKLVLQHLTSKERLEVVCHAESSHKLSVLLAKYLSLDDRSRIISILVKYWAKICKINNPDLGTLPSDAFVILVIYYLQRTSPPVLPCLHELFSKGSKTDKIKEVDRTQVYETKKLNTHANTPDKPKNGESDDLINEQLKNLELDPREDTSDNCPEEMAVNDEEIDEDEEEEGENIRLESDDIKSLNWNSSNESPMHKLFINFFKFMYEEFNNSGNVITIRTLKNVSPTSRSWGSQVKAIENPVKPRTNISRCIGTQRTFNYIKICFRHCYHYLTSLPLDEQLRLKSHRKSDPADNIELYVNRERLSSYIKMKQPRSGLDQERTPLKYQGNLNPLSEMIRQNLFERDVAVINALFERSGLDNASLPRMITNVFNVDLLVPGDVISTTFCWLCRQIGHSRQSSRCPRSKMENLKAEFETYDINIDFDANFDSGLIALYERDLITPNLSKQHMKITQDLTQIINSSTGLDCRLQLFGSTVNNLGSRDSDLDICMTLNDNPTGRGVNFVQILKKVHDVLLDVRQVHSIEPILSARVPIIKFKYLTFDVDLSMYNQCAAHNSRLLKAYSLIDQRVPQLFYLVKRYAKTCEIADASRGSLSSYAWSLMVIHYLQQTNPPILPVLQETGQNKPLHGVQGWNVWFNEDIESISLPKNDMNLTQLFKGFFLYYGNFDFNFNVVSIRKSQLITRYQKNWTNCMMAIEDPFELTYNLSSRLDDPMAIYIINSFAQAYRQIVKVQKRYIKDGRPSELTAAQKIFNGREITASSPPYRGCRFCHKIGHRLKDCPQKVDRNRQTRNNQHLGSVEGAMAADVAA